MYPEIKKGQIWDIVRKKWLQLTPEEWVRQCAVHYLVYHKGYPASLLSIEKSFMYNQLKRRYDIAVYNTRLEAQILIECKQRNIPLRDNPQLCRQLRNYHLALPTPYLILTNGAEFLCYKKSIDYLYPISDIPSYEELCR